VARVPGRRGRRDLGRRDLPRVAARVGALLGFGREEAGSEGGGGGGRRERERRERALAFFREVEEVRLRAEVVGGLGAGVKPR
jgi:hypothetical protein